MSCRKLNDRVPPFLRLCLAILLGTAYGARAGAAPASPPNAHLREIAPSAGIQQQSPGKRIILNFPEQRSMGKLLLMTLRRSGDAYDEKPYAMAQGQISVPADAIFTLTLNYDGMANLGTLAKLPPGKIAGLRIDKVGCSDAQFGGIAGLEYLRVLDLKDVEISDQALARIKNCKSLIELNLNASHISGKGLHVLRFLPQLTALNLDYNHLDDSGLAYVGTLKKLRWLRLKNTDIGDAGLAHFKGLKDLRRLIVCGNKHITDRSVDTINGLNLKKLDVTDCKLSADGLIKLKEAKLELLEFGFRDYTVGELDRIKRGLGRTRPVDGHASEIPLEVFSPLH